jgi:hypothetical protein
MSQNAKRAAARGSAPRRRSRRACAWLFMARATSLCRPRRATHRCSD